MKKIDAVVVVEGRHDSEKLKKYFDVETIETSGSHLGKDVLRLIEETKKVKEVIVLLDPDSVGEKIRQRINQAIPGLKNCFVMKEDARTSKKVGIEHADYDTLNQALQNHICYRIEKESLSYQEFLALGLTGEVDSALKREKLGKHFHLGKCNAKTMFKRLNMLKLDYQTIKEVL